MHAVVTGGGSGIGAAIALALAEQGATLTLMGRDQARLDTQARALESRAMGPTVQAFITAERKEAAHRGGRTV